MIKDFNIFLNEGYEYKFGDTFISEITDSRNVDVEYDIDRYDYIENINIKIEWILKMEVHKNGIYDFYAEGIKAIAEIDFVLNEHPNKEISKSHKYMDKFNIDYTYNEDDYIEKKVYNFEAENIKYDKKENISQIIIEEVDLILDKDIKNLIFRLKYNI